MDQIRNILSEEVCQEVEVAARAPAAGVLLALSIAACEIENERNSERHDDDERLQAEQQRPGPREMQARRLASRVEQGFEPVHVPRQLTRIGQPGALGVENSLSRL